MKHIVIKDIKCSFQQLLCEKGGQTSHSSQSPEKSPFKEHKLENVCWYLISPKPGGPGFGSEKVDYLTLLQQFSSYLFNSAQRQRSENWYWILRKLFSDNVKMLNQYLFKVLSSVGGKMRHSNWISKSSILEWVILPEKEKKSIR